jgi:hypothetical protein
VIFFWNPFGRILVISTLEELEVHLNMVDTLNGFQVHKIFTSNVNVGQINKINLSFSLILNLIVLNRQCIKTTLLNSSRMNRSDTSLCRCCLQEKGKMKNMLKEILQPPPNHKDTKITLFEGYINCSGIEPRPEDIHKSICRKCEKNLKISFEFRELCRESNETLLKTTGLDDISDVKCEEKFVYSETRSRKQGYMHSVFVAEANENDILIPEIKIEETESNVSAPEDTETMPGHIDVKVILKEEHQVKYKTLFNFTGGFILEFAGLSTSRHRF